MSDSPKEYRISSLADFAKVPPDRLDACLVDFKAFLLHVCQSEAELVRLLGPVASGTVSVGESFTWVDDGVPGIGFIDFYLGDEKLGRVDVGGRNG